MVEPSRVKHLELLNCRAMEDLVQLENNMLQNHISFLKSLFGESEETKRRIFRSIKAKADAKRTIMEKMADSMTSNFGSNTFLLLNVFLFIGWILIKMMAILLEKQGLDLSQDPELQKMLKPISEEEIEKRLEKEILQ